MYEHYIIAAYSVTGAVLALLLVSTVLRYFRHKKRLNQLESQDNHET